VIYADIVVPASIVVRSDPYITPSEDDLQLRLTYEGLLLGASRTNTRAAHKHDIRRCFHKQLKRFWDVHPFLGKMSLQDANQPSKHYAILPFLEKRYERHGYHFIPLVTDFFTLSCTINILLLRPDAPGSIVQSGDLDNRLKTIFDALRIPANLEELGGNETPAEGERPFFCLLEDDRLVTQVAVETDTLLEPTGASWQDNDARLIVKVELKPYVLTTTNAVFS